MAERAEINFVKLEAPKAGSAVVLTDQSLKLGPVAAALAEAAGGSFARAAAASKFEGKSMKTLQLLAPAGVELDRIVFIGLGDAAKLTLQDWLKLGGTIPAVGDGRGRGDDHPGAAGRRAGHARSRRPKWRSALSLRSYSFDKYKTKKKNDEAPKPRRFVIAVADPKAADEGVERRARRRRRRGLCPRPRQRARQRARPGGIRRAALRPRRARRRGEVLDEPELRKLKMGALLGVAQGSVRPPRVVVLRWKGGRDKDKPVAFVGKGVVFDTGGISIKPAAGMEDMKGDMGGAAAVAGPLPHARARARRRSTPSASSAWSRTCPTATRSAPATSSPPCPARRSR